MLNKLKRLFNSVPKKIRRFMIIGLVTFGAIASVNFIANAIDADVSTTYGNKETSTIHEHSDHAEIGSIGEIIDANDTNCGSISDKVQRGIQIERIGEATDSRGVEYTMWFYSDPQAGLITEVTMDFYGTCGTAFYPGINEHITESVPLDISRDLTLQLYERLIEAEGGLDKYQESIDYLAENPDPIPGPDGAQPISETIITSVDLWATEQLGIQIPGDYVVIDIDNQWQYEMEQPTIGD